MPCTKKRPPSVHRTGRDTMPCTKKPPACTEPPQLPCRTQKHPASVHRMERKATPCTKRPRWRAPNGTERNAVHKKGPAACTERNGTPCTKTPSQRAPNCPHRHAVHKNDRPACTKAIAPPSRAQNTPYSVHRTGRDTMPCTKHPPGVHRMGRRAKMRWRRRPPKRWRERKLAGSGRWRRDEGWRGDL